MYTVDQLFKELINYQYQHNPLEAINTFNTIILQGNLLKFSYTSLFDEQKQYTNFIHLLVKENIIHYENDADLKFILELQMPDELNYKGELLETLYPEKVQALKNMFNKQKYEEIEQGELLRKEKRFVINFFRD